MRETQHGKIFQIFVKFCLIMTKFQILLAGSFYLQIIFISHPTPCDMFRDSQRGAFLSRNMLLSSGKSIFGTPRMEEEDGKKEMEDLLYSFDLNPCGKADLEK